VITTPVNAEALETLKGYLDRAVSNAKADYEMSGMFSSGARHEHFEEMEKIKKMVEALYVEEEDTRVY
jgi:hypothetical protein